MLLNLNQVKQTLRPNITATTVPNKRLAHLFNDQRRFREVEEILPDGSSPWPITAELGRFLARAVVKLECRNILEFGAGSSSLVLAQALSLIGGGQLTSVEQDPECVRVAIQHNNSELWSATMAADEYSSQTPTGVDSIAIDRYGAIGWLTRKIGHHDG